MRAMQQEKNDTEDLEFRKAKYVTNQADFYWLITITIMKEVELEKADFYWPITMRSRINRRPNITNNDEH